MEFEEVFSGGEDSDFELDENVLRELYRADNGSVKVKPNSIKDELRTKIQHRRVSEGQQELKVVFEPPKSYELTQEEQEKIQKRKHRNRQSANQSRINRQRKLENLVKDEKKLSSDNQRLKAEVDALKKFKKRLETVLQIHVAGCNVKDNTSTGYFTNLLQYTNSADEPAEGCSMVSSRSADANPQYYSLNGDTIDTHPPYFDVPRSTTNAMQTFTRIGNGCLPSSIDTHSERFENAQLVNREQTMSLNDLSGMPLRSMSKEQKISLLKAYLKGNQSKPEVQKLIRHISQMTRTEQCMQNV